MSEIVNAKYGITKKDMRQIYWRSFTLLGSFNFETMEGLGFLYAIQPTLRKIYADDEDGYKAACHRHMAAFNMTVAPSPLVMGITLAMEQMAKENENFDVTSINAVKVSLMGPLSGIGDTFFWGIFRVIACALGVSFASYGNPLGPFVLLLAFNIPNFLTRYYGLKVGYSNGTTLLTSLQESGAMQLFTYCAGIVGVAAVGCMVASWIGITSPLTFEISGNVIEVQSYLDEICPELLSLIATLIIYACLKKKIKITRIILAIIAVGFVLGVSGVIA